MVLVLPVVLVSGYCAGPGAEVTGTRLLYPSHFAFIFLLLMLHTFPLAPIPFLFPLSRALLL